MAPLINEANDDHGTRAQPFLATMLVLDYGKLANNCLFIAGDNCSVNRRLASRMGVPLEGCASHRLKLAVQAYLKRYEEDLAQIQALMLLRHRSDQFFARTHDGACPIEWPSTTSTRWVSSWGRRRDLGTPAEPHGQ
ncbi:hypothetical protein L916_00045 [Phytophthora nicotianae]|uniref:Uncharacterized protein n=1 Tax=Phytophthora nicotianae TaxID=4792 RepID=W2JY93_PHYNI|nr:hypothetical protein L916_00045 [Phytophthora nicotianae]